MSTMEENKTGFASDSAVEKSDNDQPQSDLPNEETQRGVQDIEAVTLSWSKASLIAVFLKYDATYFTPKSYQGSNN